MTTACTECGTPMLSDLTGSQCAACTNGETPALGEGPEPDVELTELFDPKPETPETNKSGRIPRYERWSKV